MRQFDPSQNPNPLTDYDKTLHNWLRPRGEHVNQNLCQSAVREHLAKYVKYKASSFLFWFFPRTRLLKWRVDGFWRKMAHNTRCDASMCLLGSTRWPTTMGSNFLKTVKNGFLQARSSRHERIQEERRHRRLASLASLRSSHIGNHRCFVISND